MLRLPQEEEAKSIEAVSWSSPVNESSLSREK